MKFEIRHVHEIPALSELAAAIRYAARQDRKAREYQARVSANLVHAKTKADAPDDPEWIEWVAANLDVDEIEREDLAFYRAVLLGREKVDEDVRQRAMLHYGAAVEKYGCPAIDARAMKI